MKKASRKKTALIGVLKSKRDLRLLLREKWYRIPLAYLPRRPFDSIAFYQPAVFGRRGRRIEFFARIYGRETRRRLELLPDEPQHPRAREHYVKFSFRRILKLRKPIRNIIPRRVSFGFTTLAALRSARDLLQLYGVPQTEQLLAKRLTAAGIRPIPEHTITAGGKRFRLDFAVFCNSGAIAIECDNDKAHRSKLQKQKDQRKDAALKRLGWSVLRFTEKNIIERPDWCVARTYGQIRSLGGQLGSKIGP